MVRTRTLGLLLLLTLAGCTNRDFSCKGYPDQPSCRSLSQIYEAGPDADLSKPTTTGKGSDESTDPESPPTVRSHRGLSQPTSRGAVTTTGAVPLTPTALLDQPIIVTPQVLRIYMAPWVDSNDMLHDASRVFLSLTPSGSAWVFGEHTGGLVDPVKKKRQVIPRPPKNPLNNPQSVSAPPTPVPRPPAMSVPQLPGMAALPNLSGMPGQTGSMGMPRPMPTAVDGMDEAEDHFYGFGPEGAQSMTPP